MTYEANYFEGRLESKAMTEKDQKETRVAAEKHKNEWTEKEIRFLLSYRASGMTVKEMALALQRTFYAVQNKLHALDESERIVEQ